MKKLIPILMIALIIPVMLTGCDSKYNPFVKKVDYYVIVEGEGTPQKDDKGNETSSREYELTGYDKEGNEKTVKFLGMKQLKEGAFLKVIFKEDTALKYEEVQKEDIPKAAAEKLDIK
ncbi:MAG: YxeA family protein [Clostridium argentinense]|uniref:YxeA family protein n=1 Tax=Clostridium faecium TaxID=2762223 RepID=A0ABR8YWU1_9CLOT|nr:MULTISPECIES: YxeA family protein [Clostridium]MBD8048737.1 YxeA family protein [Clostridium faecium]MBS5822463.1 YxeA family protein [Clostridium argentinense]MDU1350131.1 YxeA family protein [Clostridium argentinense]